VYKEFYWSPTQWEEITTCRKRSISQRFRLVEMDQELINLVKKISRLFQQSFHPHELRRSWDFFASLSFIFFCQKDYSESFGLSLMKYGKGFILMQENPTIFGWSIKVLLLMALLWRAHRMVPPVNITVTFKWPWPANICNLHRLSDSQENCVKMAKWTKWLLEWRLCSVAATIY